MSEDEDLARAIALSLQDSARLFPPTPERHIVSDREDNEHGGEVENNDSEKESEESIEEEEYNSYDEYVKYVEHVKHLESDEDEDEDEFDGNEDDQDEEVADEYESDGYDDYEEVLDDFGGFDTYSKYIADLKRRYQTEDDARLRADLVRAVAASKAIAPSTTSVASLAFHSASN
ncbi:hypothetical protein EI94DRAFT_1805229 [Lactarius quietus]|nr:hypothetical protein EI94DRAFT_1805229 [Lactarius quietus]